MNTKREVKHPEPAPQGERRPNDAYGKAKKDMGGYIGDRSSAGDSDNPESLPGGA